MASHKFYGKVKQGGDMKLNKSESGSQTPDVWKRLAGAKTTSALISAIIRVPGLSASVGEIEQAQTALFDMHNEVTQSLSSHFNADPALKSQLGALTSTVLADVWVNQGGKLGAVEPDKVTQILKDSIDKSMPEPKQVFDDSIPHATLDSLAEARAAAKGVTVMARIAEKKPVTQRLFLGSNTPEDSVARIKNYLKKTAQEVTDSLAHPQSREEDRSIVYRSTLGCLETMFSAVMYHRYEDTTAQFRTLNGTAEGKKQLKQVYNANEDRERSIPTLVDQVINDMGMAVNLEYPEMAEKHRQEFDQESSPTPR